MLIRCLPSCVLRRVCYVDCANSSLPTCLFFHFGVFFVHFCFILWLKQPFSCTWVLAFVSSVDPWQNGSARWGLSGEWAHTVQQPPLPTYPPISGPELPTSAGYWHKEVYPEVQWGSRGLGVQWCGPQGPLQQCTWGAPQLMENEGAGTPDVWSYFRRCTVQLTLRWLSSICAFIYFFTYFYFLFSHA